MTVRIGFAVIAIIVLTFSTIQAHAESRSERHINGINRSIRDKQQILQYQQQNQFELNQMQQRMQRNDFFTPRNRIITPDINRR